MLNKNDRTLNTSLWSSTEDLQKCTGVLGMKVAIYEDAFESLDLIKFSAGMRDFILQQDPPHQYGTLLSVHTELPSGLGGHNTTGGSGGDRVPMGQVQCLNSGGQTGQRSIHDHDLGDRPLK